MFTLPALCCKLLYNLTSYLLSSPPHSLQGAVLWRLLEDAAYQVWSSKDSHRINHNSQLLDCDCFLVDTTKPQFWLLRMSCCNCLFLSFGERKWKEFSRAGVWDRVEREVKKTNRVPRVRFKGNQGEKERIRLMVPFLSLLVLDPYAAYRNLTLCPFSYLLDCFFCFLYFNSKSVVLIPQTDPYYHSHFTDEEAVEQWVRSPS